MFRDSDQHLQCLGIEDHKHWRATTTLDTDSYHFRVQTATYRNDRDNNEDSACVTVLSESAILAIVCDGLGGHDYGAEASSEATEVIVKHFQRVHLTPFTFASVAREALIEASKTLESYGRPYPRKMSDYSDNRDTTCTLAIVFPEEQLILLAHVGDSSAYLSEEGLQTIGTQTQGDGYHRVWHTVAQLQPQSIAHYTWHLKSGLPWKLVLFTDGCDVVPKDLASEMDAYTLVEKSRELGPVEKQDNSTAISIWCVPVPSEV